MGKKSAKCLKAPVDTPAATLEESFQAGACIADGCSGKKSIYTSFENTLQTTVGAPRSAQQSDNNQAPVSISEYEYEY